MMHQESKEGGFADYLYHTLRKDKSARIFFFSEMMKESVVTQLRVLRHYRGLSQIALAHKIKLPQPQLARMERPGFNPSARTLERVAKGLGARLELVPESMLPFIAAQQFRAQGQAYFQGVAAPDR